MMVIVEWAWGIDVRQGFVVAYEKTVHLIDIVLCYDCGNSIALNMVTSF
jgi:hypothetical protein